MELPLPENGVCNLGTINLTKFIKYNTDSNKYIFDENEYIKTLKLLVRFLDNVLDLSDYPYEEVKNRAQQDRRLGICGLGGLGSALAMMKMAYDSPEAKVFIENLTILIKNIAYKESALLAKEKGSFPNFDKDKFLEQPFVQTLDVGTLQLIRENGIRNVALLTAPPVGTGSLYAGNISSGIEPIFSLEYKRNIRQLDGSIATSSVVDYAWRKFKASEEYVENGKIPPYFKTSMEIDPIEHINIQALIQKHTDGSISKTINIPNEYQLEKYKELFMHAYQSGLKGFTSFRVGTRAGVLETIEEKKEEQIDNSIPSIKRPRILQGATYKIKTGNINSDDPSIYCTLNHMDNSLREIFLSSSSKNAEWLASIGRLCSLSLRKGVSPDEIIRELKAVKGDHGYLASEFGFVASVPQHLGNIIEEYYNSINNIKVEVQATKCPECGKMTYIKENGCGHCIECLHSTCG